MWVLQDGKRLRIFPPVPGQDGATLDIHNHGKLGPHGHASMTTPITNTRSVFDRPPTFDVGDTLVINYKISIS